MAADIDPLAIAAKACGIFVDPGDRAANLLGNREKAAAGILYPDKIRHDVMRAGAGEHLGRRGIGLGRPRPPGAAMDKDKDRRAAAIGIPIGAEEVELLDLGRAVRQAQRRPDALAGAFAVGDPAVTQLLDVRLIGGLVIGGIEFRLREVQIDERLAGLAHVLVLSYSVGASSEIVSLNQCAMR